MGKQPNTGSQAHEQPPSPPGKSAVVLMLGDLANTTWRMFVPTLAFLLVGRWIDVTYQTAPWGILIAAVLGFSISVWLVVKQIKEVS